MRIARRQFLFQLGTAAALAAAAPAAGAQEYPKQPVRILVGFPAGGTTDIVARLIAHWLSERLSQRFIVENRSGANASLALEALVRAPADGYTLGTLSSSSVLTSILHQQPDFDLQGELALIAALNSSPLVLEVHPAVPINTVPELISYAKTNPGRISVGSFGIGSTSHVAGELFKMMAGIHMLHVPYRGSAPMITDLIGGQIQAAFDNLPASIEHLRTGKLRALAVTGAARSEALPQVPTVSEFLTGYEAIAFVGLGAPKQTPADVVLTLNREINAGLANSLIRSRFAQLGTAPLAFSPAEFEKFIQDETEKWRKVIQAAKLSGAN
jgi:tripartite-type tricarboxylate transporter receptor subunit TctC